MDCPICKGAMKEIEDIIQEDGVKYTAFRCTHCGEELLTMKQLGKLAKEYRALRNSKETIFAKWGNSLAVRIPKEFIDGLHIKQGRTAIIKEEKGSLKITPA